jgi:NADPH2:quinone reductase
MKAIVVREFGGPEAMKLDTLPDPAPGSTQLRVRVHAAGVNPVDTYIRSGVYARKPPLPYTPGMDYAGVVDAVGTDVKRFKPGDRVYGHGTAPGHGAYAEMTLTDERGVEPLPGRVSFQQGAALGVPYATAGKALLMRAEARPGETVLVHGASGGVVSLELQPAAGSTGATVSVADCGPGIPEIDRDRVLERFVRLDASRTSPGNGLGLSLVAAIARLHNAALSLGDNEPGLKVTLQFKPAAAAG